MNVTLPYKATEKYNNLIALISLSFPPHGGINVTLPCKATEKYNNSIALISHFQAYDNKVKFKGFIHIFKHSNAPYSKSTCFWENGTVG